jgi:hypothetical protein
MRRYFGLDLGPLPVEGLPLKLCPLGCAAMPTRPGAMESKRVVHVIDDEETIRKAVGFTLRTAGFAVETYGSESTF